MKKDILLLIVCVLVLCGLPQPIGAAASDPFFEKARLIMTKEEIEIYKHLPGAEEKEEFIKEFWKKRDPTPATEENENREEFEKRIAYANKWFNEGSKGRGWDTERGRILLQLGFPDRREFGQVDDIVRSGAARNIGGADIRRAGGHGPAPHRHSRREILPARVKEE